MRDEEPMCQALSDADEEPMCQALSDAEWRPSGQALFGLQDDEPMCQALSLGAKGANVPGTFRCRVARHILSFTTMPDAEWTGTF